MPQVEQKIGEGEIQTKHCKKCGQVKTLNRFSVSSGEPDGKRRECKDCVAEYMKKYNARKRAAKAADPVKKKAPKREPVRAPAETESESVAAIVKETFEHLKGSADDMMAIFKIYRRVLIESRAQLHQARIEIQEMARGRQHLVPEKLERDLEAD